MTEGRSEIDGIVNACGVRGVVLLSGKLDEEKVFGECICDGELIPRDNLVGISRDKLGNGRINCWKKWNLSAQNTTTPEHK